MSVSSLNDFALDPRTGDVLGAVPVSSMEHVADTVAMARTAQTVVGSVSPAARARWLEGLADVVGRAADELVPIADRETGLGVARLTGEVARCANQLRFYASVCREGSWLGATIDHATADTPDLRKVAVPVGPVAVFGASNFPFGFGTLGNDTGSALAAGCPVIVKGHPAHPFTHAALVDLAVSTLAEFGAPTGTFGAVTGFDSGRALVIDDAVGAVAFTGSQTAGMSLWSLAQTRPRAIPVFAEMGTINPVVVTPAALAEPDALVALARGCVQSFTLGMGQFCTKPGLLLVPAGSGVAAAVAAELAVAAPRGPLLTAGIARSYVEGIRTLQIAGATIAGSVDEPGAGWGVCATVLTAPTALLMSGSPLLAECFGPVIIVAEYHSADELDAVLTRLQGALVGSVMTAGAEDPDTAGVVASLTRRVGRVAVDAWPTGVATSWAQHHGGPWPSTTVPAATSVGAAAVSRFTRPVAFQNAPQASLPPALADDNPWRLPRRVDGRMVPAPGRSGKQRTS